MAIPVKCTACGRGFQVGDEHAGKRVRCSCGETVDVVGSSEVMDFLSQEMNLKADPLHAETLDQWIEATGASPEIAQQIEKRMKPKVTSNAGVMMAVTGAVLSLLLIIALFAWLLGGTR